jgi:hypothetical protein
MRKIFVVFVLSISLFSCEKKEVNPLAVQYSSTIQPYVVDENAPKKFLFNSDFDGFTYYLFDWEYSPMKLQVTLPNDLKNFSYNNDRTLFAYVKNGSVFVLSLTNGTIIYSKFLGSQEFVIKWRNDNQRLLVGGRLYGILELNVITSKESTVYYHPNYRTNERVTSLVIDKDDNVFAAIRYKSGAKEYFEFLKPRPNEYSNFSLAYESVDISDIDYLDWLITLSDDKRYILLNTLYYANKPYFTKYFTYPFNSKYTTTNPLYQSPKKIGVYLKSEKGVPSLYYYRQDNLNVNSFYRWFPYSVDKLYL